MKTLPIDFDKSLINLDPREKDKKASELVFNVIDQMVQSYLAQQGGFPEPDRRRWYKIEDAFEAAIKADQVVVVLEDEWWGWLKTVRRESRMRPVKIMRIIDQLFDEVPER